MTTGWGDFGLHPVLMTLAFGLFMPLSALSYRELQAECKARGLPASGKTEVLRQRLEEAEF